MHKQMSLVAVYVVLLAVTAAAQTVTGSGTANTVPVFTGSSTVGNSVITQSSGNVGVGTTSPTARLHIAGGNDTTTGPGNCGSESPSCPASAASGYGIALDSDYVTGQWRWRLESIDRGNGIPLYVQLSGATASVYNNVARFGWDQYDNNSFAVFGNQYVSGKIGIGTTTPAQALDVSGILHVSGLLNPTTTLQGGYFGWNTLTGGYGETDFINNPGTGPGGFAFMSVPASGSPRTTALFISASGAVTFADGTTQSTAWTGVLCGGDYAESVDVSGDLKHYGPGDVLVIASGADGDVEKAAEPYSTMVAGIYATKPGVVGRRQTTAKGPDEVPMAMVGIVPAKASTENGPIHKGDLLVTASTPGYAMKGTDRSRMLGAVIGKAMGSLDSGTGVIEVLVTLQ